MNERKWDDESRQFQARGGGFERGWKTDYNAMNLEIVVHRVKPSVSTFCWNTLVLGEVPSNMRPVNKLKQSETYKESNYY